MDAVAICLSKVPSVNVSRYSVVVGVMASYSKLSDLFPIQSQLDYALEDATTQEEKENLVHQYLHKIDEKDDLIIPDFEEGKSVNEVSG